MVKIFKILIINWLFCIQKVILDGNLKTLVGGHNETEILKN